MTFRSPAKMLDWQYREIIAELQELQRHAADPTCPCTQADTGEYCLMKHALGVHTLARETASMDPRNAKTLESLAEEALAQHQSLKDRVVCGKPHREEKDTVEWARQWRKKLEGIYYHSCKVNLHQEPVLAQASLEQKSRYLYHGTTDKFLNEIKAKGLCPPRLGHVVGTPYESQHIDTVYFAPTADAAFVLADQVVYSHGGKQIVLRAERRAIEGIAESIVDREGEIAVRLKRCIPYDLLSVIRERPTGYLQQAKPVTISGKCSDAKGCSFKVKKTATTGAKACSVGELVKSVDAVSRTSCTCKPEKVTPCGAGAKMAQEKSFQEVSQEGREVRPKGCKLNPYYTPRYHEPWDRTRFDFAYRFFCRIHTRADMGKELYPTNAAWISFAAGGRDVREFNRKWYTIFETRIPQAQGFLDRLWQEWDAGGYKTIQQARLLQPCADLSMSKVQWAEILKHQLPMFPTDKPTPVPEKPLEAQSKYKLFPFQADGVRWLRGRSFALLADEMGLGKTPQAIHWAADLRPALVVVPSALVLNWQREITEMWRPDDQALVLDGKQDVPATLPDWTIMSYGMLDRYLPALKRAGFRSVVIDEAHQVKNLDAHRTQHVLELVDPKMPIPSDRPIPNRLAVTGTPILNRPIELFPLFVFLGVKRRGDYQNFMLTYTESRRIQGRLVFTGAKNLDDLHIRLKAFMLRRKKAIVLKDLPPKLHTAMFVPISNAAEYHRVERDFLGWVHEKFGSAAADRASSAELITRMNALRQLAAIGKVEPVADWLKPCQDGHGKVLVFSNFKEPLEKLARLKAGQAEIYTGELNKEERQRIVDTFQKTGAACYFLGTVGAAGVGITLTAANRVAFLDLPWTPGGKLQAEDRAHRIGQTQTVEVVNVLAKNTIDERMLKLLAEKEFIIDQAIEGKTRERALNESLANDLLRSYLGTSLAQLQAPPQYVPDEPDPDVDQVEIAEGPSGVRLAQEYVITPPKPDIIRETQSCQTCPSPMGIIPPEYSHLRVETTLVRNPPDPAKPNPVIDNARKIQPFFRLMRDADREFALIIYLDTGNRVVGLQQINIGTRDHAIIDKQAIVRAGLLSGAGGLIFAHNHPSGKARPSEEDKVLHASLTAWADEFQIKVVDSFVVGATEDYSIVSNTTFPAPTLPPPPAPPAPTPKMVPVWPPQARMFQSCTLPTRTIANRSVGQKMVTLYDLARQNDSELIAAISKLIGKRVSALSRITSSWDEIETDDQHHRFFIYLMRDATNSDGYINRAPASSHPRYMPTGKTIARIIYEKQAGLAQDVNITGKCTDGACKIKASKTATAAVSEIAKIPEAVEKLKKAQTSRIVGQPVDIDVGGKVFTFRSDAVRTILDETARTTTKERGSRLCQDTSGLISTGLPCRGTACKIFYDQGCPAGNRSVGLFHTHPSRPRQPPEAAIIPSGGDLKHTEFPLHVIGNPDSDKMSFFRPRDGSPHNRYCRKPRSWGYLKASLPDALKRAVRDSRGLLCLGAEMDYHFTEIPRKELAHASGTAYQAPAAITKTKEVSPKEIFRQARLSQEVKIKGKCADAQTCQFKVTGGDMKGGQAVSVADLPGAIDRVRQAIQKARGPKVTDKTRAIGPSRRRYEFRHRIVDAKDLIVSHDPFTFDKNPAYPEELQPRLRERAATRVQVHKIAARLDPEMLLLDFLSLDKGSPIIGPGPENIVECGNGRLIALIIAAREHPANIELYKMGVKEAAAAYGLEVPETMELPVLVRERLTPMKSMAERQAFAEECNASTVIKSSAVEKARTDAPRISVEMLNSLDIGEDQSLEKALKSSANKGFIRAFLGRLAEEEQNELVDAQGVLNADGLRRIILAMFVRAFPGDVGLQLAGRFFEETEGEIKNVANGIARSLGSLAKSEAMTASGEKYQSLSIGADLSKTVNIMAALEGSDMDVPKYLAQGQLGKRELTPFQERILADLYSLRRSGKRVSDVLKAYADKVIASPPPSQGGMFGGGEPSREAYWSAAMNEVRAIEEAEKAERARKRQAGQLVETGSLSCPGLACLMQKAVNFLSDDEIRAEIAADNVRKGGRYLALMHEAEIRARNKRMAAMDELKKARFTAVHDISVGQSKLKSGETVRILEQRVQPGTGAKQWLVGDERGRTFAIGKDSFDRLFQRKDKYQTPICSIRTCTIKPVQAQLFQSYSYLVKKLDKCNLDAAEAEKALAYKPLRELIEMGMGSGAKVQLCHAGIVAGTYQATFQYRMPYRDGAEAYTAAVKRLESHAARSKIRQIQVVEAGRFVFQATVPEMKCTIEDLLGGKQFIPELVVRGEKGEQARMFRANLSCGPCAAMLLKPGIALTDCERRHGLGGALERCVLKVKEKPGVKNPYAIYRAVISKPVCGAKK